MAHIKVDRERCKGCELCVHTCSKKLIAIGATLNGSGYRPAEFDLQRADECEGCAQCGLICPDVAITVYRESKSK